MDHQPSPSSSTAKNNTKMVITAKHPKKSPSPLTLSYTITFASFLIIAFQSLAFNRARAPSTTHQNELSFHPLKDPRAPPYTLPNKTWFMSTLTGRQTPDGMPEHFSTTTRTRGMASTPSPLLLVDGRPARFVLFKNVEAVGRVERWVACVLKAGLVGQEPKVEILESMHGTTSVACYEKAVVFRRGLGGMSTERRHRLFDMGRCKVWALCNAGSSIDGEVERKGLVRATLTGREGKRPFKNESGVEAGMEREFGKFTGCSLKLVHLHNMSFCEQVCT